jgi:hypothetical protein
MNLIGELTKVQYIESKFDRECGDDMVYAGERMKVGIVGDNKEDVVEAINRVIKKQNSLKRKIQRNEDAKSNKIFNDILGQAWRDIHKDL